MRLMLSIILVLYCANVSAQQSITPLTSHISISGQDCVRMTKSRAVPGANYTPGVDVHGKPVAPADLPGSGGTIQVPQVIEFDYTINPMTYGGANSLASKGLDPGNTQMSVAHIKYDMGTNTFTINGQPISSGDQAALSRECAKHLGK